MKMTNKTNLWTKCGFDTKIPPGDSHLYKISPSSGWRRSIVNPSSKRVLVASAKIMRAVFAFAESSELN